MKCIYCTNELPIDSNSKTITCKKCGSEFSVVLRFSPVAENLFERELEPIDKPNEPNITTND